MKTYVSLLTVLSCLVISNSVVASGTSSSAYQGALFNGDSTKFYEAVHSGGPSRMNIAVNVQQQKRTLNSDSGMPTDIKINHLNSTLGYDITKWLTVYGGLGTADSSTMYSDNGSDFEWLAGGTIRALDYMVLEPWNGIDQYYVGVDINSFYRNTSVESQWSSNSENLSEIFASITMSFYSKPDKGGSWDRVGFYVGPAMSMLSMGDQSEDQLFGLLGGLQLNPNPNMSIKLELQQFEDLGMGASFAFHF